MYSHRQVFRRLNLDADESALRPHEYSYLKNGVPLQNFDGHDWSIGSVLGTDEQANGDLPAGTNTVIGRLVDAVGDRLFYCIHNSNNDHTIYQLDNAYTFTRVLRTSLFAWTSTMKIDMDILDDLLVLTDDTNEIVKIDVAKAIAGVTYTPAVEQLTLIKRPPQLPLDNFVAAIDGSFTNNYVWGNTFQFFYRYIYENNDPSVWSPVSDVVSVDVTVSGYNRIDVFYPPVGETIPVTAIQIDFAVRVNGSNELIIYKSVFPVGGVLSAYNHAFYNNILLETVPDSQSMKWCDAVPRTSKSLRFKRNRLFLFNNLEGYTYKASPISGITLTVTNTAGTGRTFKDGGSYSIGIMFFDTYRRSAGVHIGDSTTTIIPYRTTSDDLQMRRINVDISAVAQADIPTWATHFSIVRTKVKNVTRWLQHKSAHIAVLDIQTDGTYVYGSTNTYLAVDIGPLNKINIGYTFQAGDRIRIYTSTPAGTIDSEIIRQVGNYLHVRYPDASIAGIATPAVYNYEIYTPKNDAQEVFYEDGAVFTISNPGTGSRAFSTTSITLLGDSEIVNRSVYQKSGGGFSLSTPEGGETTAVAGTFDFCAMHRFDKNFDKWAADGSWRPMPLSRVGSSEFQKTNYIRFGGVYFKDSGVSNLNVFEELDEYPLPINHGPGTKLASAGDIIVAICEKASSSIFIGEGFINVKTGNFLAKTDAVIGDDQKYFGNIGCLHMESVVEEGDRVYWVDMTKGVIVRRSNDGITIISNYGVRNYVKKWCRENYANGNASALRWYGGWDPVHNLYVVGPTLHANGSNYWTLGFCEGMAGVTDPFWVGFFDYAPQWYAQHLGYMISFNNGKVWRHASTYMNFYGVQKTRTLEFAVAIRGPIVGVWKSLRLDAESFYDDSGSNDEVVTITNNGAGIINSGPGGQNTSINYLDLQAREGFYISSIYMDKNTPQPFAAGKAKYEGSPMRGNIIRVKIVANKTSSVGRIRGLEIWYTVSQLSMPANN